MLPLVKILHLSRKTNLVLVSISSLQLSCPPLRSGHPWCGPGVSSFVYLLLTYLSLPMTCLYFHFYCPIWSDHILPCFLHLHLLPPRPICACLLCAGCSLAPYSPFLRHRKHSFEPVWCTVVAPKLGAQGMSFYLCYFYGMPADWRDSCLHATLWCLFLSGGTLLACHQQGQGAQWPPLFLSPAALFHDASVPGRYWREAQQRPLLHWLHG